ncbi:hypothetical protein V5E97_39655 [Singulisphaera sp. Ch08]|uniref:Uncharacterized protein n=1 Tax=Singulisphaera sp. Ch08 TaxID=3120278 RepID=A0AAU7CI83_9BACT
MESWKNETWVCFDCRETVRRPSYYRNAVPCPKCGFACHCIGTKIRIPAKGDKRAWRDLREGIRERLHADQERLERMRVQHRHRLEQQIVEMEAKSANQDRAITIHRLRERLATM